MLKQTTRVLSIQWGNNLQQMMLGQLDIHMQRMTLDPYTSCCIQKTNSKWITDINLRAKTTKFLEENIRINLCDAGLSNGFLGMTPKQLAT